MSASPTNLIISPPFLPIIFIKSSMKRLKQKDINSGFLIPYFDNFSGFVIPFNSAYKATVFILYSTG